MGFKIFILCLRQVLNNWKMAFRLSWFWILAMVFAYVVIFSFSFYLATVLGSSGRLQVPFWLLMIVVPLIAVPAMISGTVVAIGWHRFVLREEIPDSFYVLHRGWPLGRYIWNSLKIGLIISLLAIAILYVFSLLAPEFMVPGWGMKLSAVRRMSVAQLVISLVIFQPIIGIVFVWVFLRMGLVFPAIAVGKKLSLRDSFRLTDAIAGPLVITAISMILFQFIPKFLDLLLTASLGSGTFLTTLVMPLVTLVFAWFSFFIGFGVLTVVYGHLVENRPI